MIAALALDGTCTTSVTGLVSFLTNSRLPALTLAGNPLIKKVRDVFESVDSTDTSWFCFTDCTILENSGLVIDNCDCRSSVKASWIVFDLIGFDAPWGTTLGVATCGTTFGLTLGPQATFLLLKPALDPNDGKSFKEGNWESTEVGGVSSYFDMLKIQIRVGEDLLRGLPLLFEDDSVLKFSISWK